MSTDTYDYYYHINSAVSAAVNIVTNRFIGANLKFPGLLFWFPDDKRFIGTNSDRLNEELAHVAGKSELIEIQKFKDRPFQKQKEDFLFHKKKCLEQTMVRIWRQWER